MKAQAAAQKALALRPSKEQDRDRGDGQARHR